jgi:hypothetical protein
MNKRCFIDFQIMDGKPMKTKPAVVSIATMYRADKAKLRNNDVVLVQEAAGVHNGQHFTHIAVG